jgi:hypothetical protein
MNQDEYDNQQEPQEYPPRRRSSDQTAAALPPRRRHDDLSAQTEIAMENVLAACRLQQEIRRARLLHEADAEKKPARATLRLVTKKRSA